MPHRYRVRGIYATAVARLLLDEGHELVDLSKQLAERLGMDQRSDVPPDATIKVSDEDPDTLVIVGKPDAVGEAFELLASTIPFSINTFLLYGPSTSAKGRVIGVENGKCIVETPIGRGILSIDRCEQGQELWVHVARVPRRSGESYVFRKGLAVVMDTVTLVKGDGGRISFSEHIKGWERKAELTMLAQDVARKGISVRWRSAARSAPLEKLSNDLREGLEALEAIERECRDVVIGESIAFITLCSESKRFLDEVRRRVLPTTPRHHELKARWDSSYVDLLDVLSAEVPPEAMDRGVERLCIEWISYRGSASLIHRKPGGEVIKIGPAEVLGHGVDEVIGRYLALKRVAKSEGIYDGLGVPKEVGDVMISIVPTRRWFLAHAYYSSRGELKGIYVNVNTPPELSPSGEISYLDLLIDVAYTSEGPRVIDREQLDKAVEEGEVPPDLALVAVSVAEEIARSLELLERIKALASSYLEKSLG